MQQTNNFYAIKGFTVKKILAAYIVQISTGSLVAEVEH